MTVLEYLKANEPVTAKQIADALSMSLDKVYMELVAAEARDEARVDLYYYGGGEPMRHWTTGRAAQ